MARVFPGAAAPGLTTRQLYALAAMHAIIGNCAGFPDAIAQTAFQIADAMVREEEK